MAQPLRRPLFAAVSQCCSPLSRRTLSQTTRLLKVPQKHVGKPSVMGNKPSQPSLKVLQKAGTQMPGDLGLLPGTIVTPSYSNQPSPFTSPKTAFWLLRKILFNRFRDRASLLLIKWSSPKTGFMRRRMKIQRGKLTSIATGLHRQMYTAFAEADVPTIRKLCADGVRDSLLSRIGRRERGETVTWELVRYGSRAKVMSDRSAKLPIEGAALRQAVVRITSTQKLTRMKDGRVVGGSGKEKEVTEFVVLQRKMEGWVEGDWKVWGTTKETTVEELKQLEEDI